MEMPSGGWVEKLDYQEFTDCIETVTASAVELKDRLAGKVARLRQEALRGADLVAELAQKNELRVRRRETGDGRR
jgi:hypothetical protein